MASPRSRNPHPWPASTPQSRRPGVIAEAARKARGFVNPGETIDMEVGFERVLVDHDGQQWLITIGKDGILWKLDRKTGAFGEVLWQTRLGAALHGFPITYAVDGKQYIAVPTGMGVFKLLTAKQSPDIYQPNGGNELYVFRLPDRPADIP